MKLANIVLKMDRIGNSVPLRYVTPAEVMFLIADHHANAGGDPIVTLEEIEVQTDKDGLKLAEEKLQDLEAQRKEVDDDANITPEVRQNRMERLNYRVQMAQDIVNTWKYRIALRSIDPANEKKRLSAKYGGHRVSRVFPGQFPSFPDTFETARGAGIGATSPTEEGDKYIMFAEGPR